MLYRMSVTFLIFEVLSVTFYIVIPEYYLEDGRYFDTKYMKVLQIKEILPNFEDQKIANFLMLNRSIFVWHLTSVIHCGWNASAYYSPGIIAPQRGGYLKVRAIF